MSDMISCEDLRKSLVNTALAAFRIRSSINSLLRTLDPSVSQKYVNVMSYQIASITRDLANAGMALSAVVEGDEYEPGLPFNVQNIADFDPDSEHLVVDQILEPAILSENGIYRVGTMKVRNGSK